MKTDPKDERGLSVLVVEDEPRLRELLVGEIPAMGHRAIGCRSAEEALEILDGQAIDVLLLDLNLPMMGGMELFKQVHESHAGVAVVVMTGYADAESAVQSLRWQAADYLTKPCGLGEVEAVLGRLWQAALAERKVAADHDGARGSGDDKLEATMTPAGRTPRTLEEIEREHILAVLAKHSGHKPTAAEELGISLRTLYNKLNQYQADPAAGRPRANK